MTDYVFYNTFFWFELPPKYIVDCTYFDAGIDRMLAEIRNSRGWVVELGYRQTVEILILKINSSCYCGYKEPK